MLGEPTEFHGLVPQWGPLFWQLAEHSAEGLLDSGDAWQQTLAGLRAQGEEPAAFEQVFVTALRRLEELAGQDHVRWYDLMRIVLSWALWRRPRAERPTLLAVAQAAQASVERQKEVGLVGQTIAEAIWEEGWVRGQAEGQLQNSRHVLLRLLAERFGSVPDPVVQRIEASSDVDRLTNAALEVSRLARADDLQL